ncbi:MAG: malonyl CoA-acyl carrier protein transacylase [Myxococcales bacterium]|nr:malonyl CoA-acyl carrier protein transacylase [Myxococcales bacterium]
MSTAVLMFPGQSSKCPDMIEKLASTSPESAALVARASEILGRDLLAHYGATNTAMFASNRDVQVGVFLANHLHLAALTRAGVEAAWSVGLSLGEYNHLVHIGALTFEDALPLIDARGRLYEDAASTEAESGVMVSVFPVEAGLVEHTITALGLGGRAVIGLYNSPRQQVLSGERAAVDQVIAALEAEVFVDATVIEPRIPMHAPRFAPVGERLGAVLADTRLTVPRLPYVPNVLGTVLEAATVGDVRSCLVAHASQSVRWQASIEALAARVSDPVFVEVGPRAVLYNMIGRGWTPGRRAKTDGPDLGAIAAELEYAG